MSLPTGRDKGWPGLTLEAGAQECAEPPYERPCIPDVGPGCALKVPAKTPPAAQAGRAQNQGPDQTNRGLFRLFLRPKPYPGQKRSQTMTKTAAQSLAAALKTANAAQALATAGNCHTAALLAANSAIAARDAGNSERAAAQAETALKAASNAAQAAFKNACVSEEAIHAASLVAATWALAARALEAARAASE